MRRLRRLCLGSVVALIVVACSPAASPSPPESSAAPSAGGSPASSAAPTVGGAGNLVISTDHEPENLVAGTVGTSDDSMVVMRNLFQSLVGRDSETFELVPELAESWERVDDTTWRFQLRPGVSFHDGSPFDAAAAVAALTATYDASLDGVGGFVGPAATFTAVGDDVVEMKTESPDPIVPTRMTMVPITSAKQLTEDPDSMAEHPIGTGPYEFVQWDKGSAIKLKLFEDSWLAGPGMFDTVEWQFRPEAAVRAQQVQTGEADVTNGLSADQCGSITCQPQSITLIYLLRIDQVNQALLGDQRVRQAIAMAVDREAISTAFFSGSPVLENATPEHSAGFVVDGVKYPFDLQAAKDLLAEAAADGVDITLPVKVKYVAGRDPIKDNLGPVVEANLKALGLNATIETMTLDEAVASDTEFIWQNGKTQADMPKDRGTVWIQDTGNELLDMSFPASSWWMCTGAVSVYCDPEIDAELTEAFNLDGDARDQAFQDIWTKAYADVPVLPLAQNVDNWAFSDRITVPTRPDGILPLWLAQAN